MLIVRLIRAEDIPMEREATGTYVDVNILPLNLQSHTFQPSDTTININFRYKNFFLSLIILAIQRSLYREDLDLSKGLIPNTISFIFASGHEVSIFRINLT